MHALNRPRAELEASADLAALYGKVSRHLLPLLFLAYTLNFMDRSNISYARLQMNPDLGFTDADYGLGAGIFYVGYLFCELPSTLLMRVIGARTVLSWVMLGWGAVSAATLWVSTPHQFYAARFLLGIFEGGFFPCVVLYLTHWYPAARRAKVVGVLMAAAVCSLVVTGPLSGWMLTRLNDVGGLRGWQWLFLLQGLPSVVLGAVVHWRLANTPQDAAWLDERERQVIEAMLRIDSPSSESSLRAGLISALRVRSVYLFAYLGFCVSCATYTLSLWMPTIIHELGVHSAQTVGLYTLVPYVSGAVAMLALARHSDAHGERRWHFAASAFCGALGLVLTTLTGTHLWLAIAAMSLASAGASATLPVFWAAATSMLTEAAAPAGIATITTLAALAGVICPYALGLIKTATGSLNLGIVGVAMALASAGMLMLWGGPRSRAK